MEQGLKERLVGAAVLVTLAVIFIPMLLDDSEDTDVLIMESNIPPKPENMPSPPGEDISTETAPPQGDFSSRIIPLEKDTPAVQAPEAAEETTTKTAPVTTAETTPKTPLETTAPESLTTGQTSTTAVMERDEPVTNVGLSAWVVQLGSFSSEVNAESLNQKLRKAGFRSFVEPLKVDNKQSYRVRVGPELKRSDAQAVNEKLKKTMQLEGIVVQYP